MTKFYPSGPTPDDLRIIVESMAIPAARASRNLHYVWVNEPYASWLSLSPDQIIGRPIVDVLGQHAFEALRPRFERALRGERVEYEEEIHFSGLGERWVRATYIPTFGPDQVPDGWVAVVLDIDDHRRAENALREYNHLLLKLHEASTHLVRENDLPSALQITLDAVIAATHADFGTLQVVDEKTQVLRVVAHRHLGPEFLEFFSEVEGNRGSCGAAQTFGARVVVENVRLDPIFAEPSISAVMSRARVEAVQSTPLLGRNGQFLGVVSTHFRKPHRPTDEELRIVDLFARQAADLIENRRVSEQLDRASRAKDHFLAILSHELRNPLTPIKLAASTLAKRGDGNRRELQIIQRQVSHLTRLVDDLLDVERLAHGRIEFRFDQLKLSTVIAATVEGVLPLIQDKRQHLDVRISEPGLVIFGDLTRLRQLLANLLNNAACYSAVGGHISIRTERAGADVLVRVRDDGEGIDPESLPHILRCSFRGLVHLTAQKADSAWDSRWSSAS